MATGLCQIRIPKPCTMIGRSCFWGCKDLDDVSFEPDSELTTIGELAFVRTAIGILKLPKKINAIENRAFPENTFIDVSETEFTETSKTWFYES